MDIYENLHPSRHWDMLFLAFREVLIKRKTQYYRTLLSNTVDGFFCVLILPPCGGLNRILASY